MHAFVLASPRTPVQRRFCALQQQEILQSKLVKKLTQLWPVHVQPFKGADRVLFVARENLPEGMSLIHCVPYAAVVHYESTEKYCSHCQFPVSLKAYQSNYTFDFYNDVRCRNSLDFTENRHAAKLRNEFHSRMYDYDRTMLREGLQTTSTMQPLCKGLSEGTLYKLLASILSFASLESSSGYTRSQFLRRKNECEQDECLRLKYMVSFEELQEMPLRTSSIQKLSESTFYSLNRVARSTKALLNHREDYNLMSITYEDIMDLLLRIYCYHQPIMRQVGTGGEVETGVGLYPASAFIKTVHDADEANCEYHFDYNVNLIVKARRPLFRGEKIMVSERPVDRDARELL